MLRFRNANRHCPKPSCTTQPEANPLLRQQHVSRNDWTFIRVSFATTQGPCATPSPIMTLNAPLDTSSSSSKIESMVLMPLQCWKWLHHGARHHWPSLLATPSVFPNAVKLSRWGTTFFLGESEKKKHRPYSKTVAGWRPSRFFSATKIHWGKCLRHQHPFDHSVWDLEKNNRNYTPTENNKRF